MSAQTGAAGCGGKLSSRHIGALAQGFEQFPDRYAAQRLANTGKKHRTGMNAVFLAPTGQAVAELSGQQDLPAFAFAADRRLVPAGLGFLP